jgi:RNA polymerase sigma factor for flagellar operon FliA
VIAQLNKAVNEIILNGPESLTLLTDFFSLLDSSKLDTTNTYPSYSLDDRRVYVIQNTEELINAVESLKLEKLLGFDTEQRPTFKKNEKSHGIATIQLASLSECYIFQVKKIDNLSALIELLENGNIAKVGINLTGDNHALYSEFKTRMKATIEIDSVLSKLSSKNSIGAKKAAKIFLKKDLQKSKKMSTSNWENDILSDSQIKYAGEDAALALDITIHLINKYPFVLEAMPGWFQINYENGEYKI